MQYQYFIVMDISIAMSLALIMQTIFTTVARVSRVMEEFHECSEFNILGSKDANITTRACKKSNKQ